MQPQTQLVVDSLVALGTPGATLVAITTKVYELNDALDHGYKADTLNNSVRRAIYDNLGDDANAVFVREARGYYRLSSLVLINAIAQADAWRLAKLLPTESLDLIITDPPWTYMDKHLATGTTTRLQDHGWFETRDVDAELIQEFGRALKTGRHMYLFFPALSADTWETMIAVLLAFHKAGLNFEKALVWDKQRIGMGYRYRYQHELILFASKGKKRRLNDLGVPDVLAFKSVHPKERIHNAQKPLPLIELLVRQSSEQGELVADFFAGSGVTPQAAKLMGRLFFAADIELEWVQSMAQELEPALVLPLKGDE